ncbi:MAG: hydratase [Clostridiales bacterium]|nr:hydratase [Clostridiales bacterium]
MVTYTPEGVFYKDGRPRRDLDADIFAARQKTLAYQILQAHNISDSDNALRIKFDALCSHDITYVGIIQTARASGLKEFPVPYVMTNCHNSLCAVGGTINEDDHVFGLSAAKKFGGIFVPPNLAVIHSYMREEWAACGNMILGSDSHTRYGALGTMGVGEGGPELVKQLVGRTYDLAMPQTVLVYLTGAPKRGVGPHDVALALIKAVFAGGLVKNKVLEFCGPGITNLSVDFRNGIDVMTTETTCLSSIWETDEQVQEYFAIHGRPEAYRKLAPDDGAYYDALIEIDLSQIACMIALPFHPSNAYTIHEFQDRAAELLAEADERLADKAKPDGVWADQGIIAGCAGGLYENIGEAADILRGRPTGSGYFSLSVYPQSIPVAQALNKSGAADDLLNSGAVLKPCFCGPCFGAGDVPSNNALSIRHTTRNFPSREGSKPGEGQLATVALMDARSIAATAANGGKITAATDVDYTPAVPSYAFDDKSYLARVYNGYGKADPTQELRFGPNIGDYPPFYPLAENLELELCAVLHDDVTTTDELIPSGETSSYRSNPERLAQFALSRRVPDYVARSKRIREYEVKRQGNIEQKNIWWDDLKDSGLFKKIRQLQKSYKFISIENTAIGSCIFARKPGDGSAREQAASCQRVLGGMANICYEYATKRYRSNCINWGILPFTIDEGVDFPYEAGDTIFVPNIRQAVAEGRTNIPAEVRQTNGQKHALTLHLGDLTDEERQILLAGCLMNYYKSVES